MKVDTEIQISAPADRIWKTLLDFSAYGDWNPFIKAVRGEVAPDARLEFDMAYSQGYGRGTKVTRSTEAALVTGFVVPRYFSWIVRHGLGSWWLSAEHVFRLKEREDGRVTFFHEAFYTGFSMVKVLGFLDFRRDAMEKKAKPSMLKMNEALKARVEDATAV